MAAAHVSAIAAMILASGVIPKTTASALVQAVTQRLKQTARSIGLSPSQQGAGLIDAAQATAPDDRPGAPQGSRGGRSRSGGADDDHAAGGVMGDVVGDAAEEEAAGTRHPLVADHDQVGASSPRRP